jgi:hypothetical protein
VFAKSHDERLAVDGAVSWGIPSDAKLKTTLEVQFLSVSGQSEVEIYIIGSTLKHMPSTMTIAHPSMEIYAGEFPQMRNYNKR